PLSGSATCLTPRPPILRQRFPYTTLFRSIGALAMTEPDGGSDVKAIRSTAPLRDGHYVLNGSKTFISNASTCDVVIVVARTESEDRKSTRLNSSHVKNSYAVFCSKK